MTSGPGTTPNQAGEPVAGPMVFISHASQDHVVAEEICRLLEEDGIRCWIAPRNVDPGHDYAGRREGEVTAGWVMFSPKLDSAGMFSSRYSVRW